MQSTTVTSAPQVAATPQGCTNLKLRQLMRRVAQHYETEMASCGLKATQYSLLSHVLKLGPLRLGELAQAMWMQPSTLTRNLRPLLDAGWVVLESGADARSRVVRITDAGLAKRQEAQHCWKTAQLGLNRMLGEQRVHALHGMIDECLDLLAPVAGASEDDE